MFGNGEPLLVLNGAGQTMNDWPPSVLKVLSSNHTVIMFDQRGIGNTTVGSNPYTYQQLADDTAGLLDALKIPKANVMGHSLGSLMAQAFTISYPEKVNSVTLISSSCGGKDGIPKPPEFRKLQDDFVNKSLHNIPVTEEIKALLLASYGSGWVKLHPEVLDIPANFTLQQATPGVPPETAEKQQKLSIWEENTNWSGVCDAEAKLAKPTLVITGTEDNDYVPHGNALIIAGKIPGAWLVQIKDAGHAVPTQYPEELGRIVNTFLSTVPNN
jgi:pimeloyl-ACP methyl ester carboxylesterase